MILLEKKWNCKRWCKKLQGMLIDFLKIVFSALNNEKDKSILCETGKETDPAKISFGKGKKIPKHFKDRTTE